MTTMPTALLMRPIASTDDSFAAVEMLAEYIGDEPWKLDELAPGGDTFHPVAIAVDGSAAEFAIYADADWKRTGAAPLLGLILRR